MSTNSETSPPRLAGTILCTAASVLLLLSALYLFAGRAGGWGAGVLVFVALGLFLAALRSFRRQGRRV